MWRWLYGPPVAPLLEGRNNHFNLVRLTAALAVLVSHAFALSTGNDSLEPMRALTGSSLGNHAVALFFGISGLLIARSFDRRLSIWHFGVSRFMRIWPALFLVLLLTVGILGPLMSTLDFGNYFAEPGTWLYLPSNLSLAFRRDELPGVFVDNPYPLAVNGSLWTLFYEVVLYGGVVMAGVLGLLRRPRLFAIVLLLALAGNVGSILYEPVGGIMRRLDLLGRNGLAFAFGAAIYVWRDTMRLGPAGAIGLIVITLAFVQTQFLAAAFNITLIYIVFWLALVPKGALLKFNRLGDYSYRIYIFAFPTQQALIAVYPGQGPWLNVALATPVTICLAVLSWLLVEERSLQKSHSMADWLAGLIARNFRGITNSRSCTASRVER